MSLCDICNRKPPVKRLTLRDLDGVRLVLDLCERCLETELPGPRSTHTVESLTDLSPHREPGRQG